MKTDSAVIPLNTAQKRYAIKSQASFVNLYTLMGGDGSMVQWVEQEPSRANKDYTHKNNRGAKEKANFVNKQPSDDYEAYHLLKKKKKKAVKPIKEDSIFTKTDSVYEN